MKQTTGTDSPEDIFNPLESRRHLLLPTLVACCAVWLTAALPLRADEPRYSVTHLGDVPGKSQVVGYLRGLNNRGQVAGFGFNGFIVDEVAFVWDGELQYLPTWPGAILGRAQSLNDRGQVVGEIAFAANNRRATLWDKGAIYDLGGLPDHEVNVAFSINNRSQVVGSSRKSSNLGPEPVLWHKGRIIALPLPAGSAVGAAFHINDSGQIVGISGPLANDRAVLWEGGTVIDLGTLGGLNSRANAINNRGRIAGRASLANGQVRAVLWDDGHILDLGTLGGIASAASCLNDRGQVVGNARTLANALHAFLWEDGEMVDLNALIPADSGWELQSGEGINNRGQISGYGLYGGALRAFLLTPAKASDAGEDHE